ncbi:lysophospholipid acyltransferase family protein [Streptomyces sp. CC208A]|uniref:lysophospholipid acyltransferase family protein n=1 Tax=Streptomyces sp. CC208A TaxID=3044573 RepID=UPI0024A868D9|nr:lysophospholipid acyltransferase family protein [Streptomyces sp. CC208A]
MNGADPIPSPWLPTAPCTPGRHCAAHPEAAGAAAPRTAPVPLACARLVAGIAAVLLGVLLLPVAGPLPAAARLALVRLWVRAVVRAFGVRLTVTGVRPPAGRPLLVVADHVSWLDIPLVAAVLPGRMVAKREVRGWPVLGALAALGGTVFLDRDGLRRLPGTVREVAGALAVGGRVTVFPEGSTWCGRAGGRFRPALFQAAVDTGSDVQPVRIGYRPTWAAAYVGEDPLGASLWRVVRARGLTAEIRILDPISVIQYPDRRLLAAAAQRAVQQPVIQQTSAQQPATRLPAVPRQSAPAVLATPAAYRAVASDSANRPSSSVHHRASSSPASASSARTPS